MSNGKKKRSKKKVIIFGGIGVVIIILLLLAFLGGSKEEIIGVETQEAQKRTITQTVSATGKIDSEFKVKITPEVTGEIVALPVDEGEVVDKGELLIKINAKQYIAEKQSAEANLQSAKATLDMKDAELNRVEAEFQRTKKLHTQNLASDAEFEAARSAYLIAKADYERAEANVSQMEALLKKAQEEFYKTTISAPMIGTITQLNVELGERVLGSGFSQGTDIMTVSDMKSMEASVDVDENDIVLISQGDTAKITVDAFGDRIFKGIVTEIGNTAITTGLGTQEQVVNFNVKLRLLDLDPELRPGMSCYAEIQTETKKDVVSVPIQSVTARSDFDEASGEEEEGEDGEESGASPINNEVQEIVFVVDGGKVSAVEVKTGISDNNYIEITSGLSGGEEVVSGSYRAISRELSDGAAVRVESDNEKMSKK